MIKLNQLSTLNFFNRKCVIYVTKERERETLHIYTSSKNSIDLHTTSSFVKCICNTGAYAKHLRSLLECHVFIDHPVDVQSTQLINQDCRCDRS